jgi:hypothetical protein
MMGIIQPGEERPVIHDGRVPPGRRLRDGPLPPLPNVHDETVPGPFE